jgi:hypothetical protein
MAKKKKSGTKPLTQKELKAMLAKQESNLAAAQERLTQAEETYTSLTTPSPAATIDSDLIRSRVTGLSEAQQQAKDTLLDIAEEQGGGYLRTLKSAGQVVPKPTEVLPEGVEWKWSPKTGGSGEWIKVRTSEPFTGGNGKNGGNGGNGGSGGGTWTASDGTVFTDQNAYVAYENNLRNKKLASDAATAAATAERKSAYDLLYQQFAKYGLQALVTPLEGLIKEGVPASEFAIRLRETDAYQKRFAANKIRINKGLAALSEAEYIGLEDAYQGIMRQYGMPESYYARGEMGRQEGFEKFIGGDVSPAELETRISTAYNRVINTNPEVVQALKQFYPNITNGDILSYALDPDKALTDINKKVTAAEIGGAAIGAGLGIGLARAEELGAFGVSKAQAQQGYQTIADILPSATKLSSIYAKQGLGAYDQAVAEQEVFGISGAATAAQKRRKLTELETAQFSGQTGVGALARERAGQF